MAKASIIIATHSRPHLLPRAVESAFSAGDDVEVIVVDDASTDETAAVCKHLCGIKYVRLEENQRTAGARNVGLLASTAPYVGFLDDDDWRLPGSLNEQINILDEHPECGLAYGKFQIADRSGKVLDASPAPEVCITGDLFWQLLESNRFGCLTVLFRKECLFKVGMLDPHLSGIDDWDLWIRISEFYPIMALEKPVAVWTKAEPTSGQGSSDESKLYDLANRAYRTKWFKLKRVVERTRTSGGGFLEAILRQNSERIVYDMVYRTAGRKMKIRKVVQVLRSFPQRLLEPSFYSMLAQNLVLRGSRKTDA